MSDKRPVGTHLGPELYDYVAGVTARRNISASKYLHELVLNDMDPLSADKEINAVTLTNILDRLGIQDQKIDFFFALFVVITSYSIHYTKLYEQGGTFALAQKILWRRGCDRRAG